MTKTANNDIKLAQGEETIDLRGLEEIKTLVKSAIQPGQSKTVDEIIGLSQLKNYKGTMIEKAINMLIDDEVLDGTEGKSVKKLQGTIGRVIRRYQ